MFGLFILQLIKGSLFINSQIKDGTNIYVVYDQIKTISVKPTDKFSLFHPTS